MKFGTEEILVVNAWVSVELVFFKVILGSCRVLVRNLISSNVCAKFQVFYILLLSSREPRAMALLNIFKSLLVNAYMEGAVMDNTVIFRL